MKQYAMYRCVIVSFCFSAGGAAALAAIWGLISLIFWNKVVFTILFCGVWAGHAIISYYFEDPEWADRSRILIRLHDKEERF